MFKGTIEKRVLAVVKARIAEAEKTFREESRLLEKQCDVDIRNLELKLEDDKTTLADKLVTGVLNFQA